MEFQMNPNEFTNAFQIGLIIIFVIHLILQGKQRREDSARLEKQHREDSAWLEKQRREDSARLDQQRREDLARQKERSQNLEMGIHQIKSMLPASIVHIVLTPSMASVAKDNGLVTLMHELDIDWPNYSKRVFSNEHGFGEFQFNWRWSKTPTESDSYKPFVAAFNAFRRKKEPLLVAEAVGNGKRLYNELPFFTALFSLRQFDKDFRKVGNVLYRGECRGRSDIVIMPYNPKSLILRHNVHIAIEVKTDLTTEASKRSAVRDGIIQLFGLCGANIQRTPPVIVTDFVSTFMVMHLVKVTDYPLKFAIKIDRSKNIKSALSLAVDISCRPSISADFGRCDTPAAVSEVDF